MRGRAGAAGLCAPRPRLMVQALSYQLEQKTHKQRSQCSIQHREDRQKHAESSPNSLTPRRQPATCLVAVVSTHISFDPYRTPVCQRIHLLTCFQIRSYGPALSGSMPLLPAASLLLYETVAGQLHKQRAAIISPASWRGPLDVDGPLIRAWRLFTRVTALPNPPKNVSELQLITRAWPPKGAFAQPRLVATAY